METNRWRMVASVSVVCVCLGAPTAAAAITRAQADSAYNAWHKLWWNASNNTFYKKDDRTGRIDFWRYAHDWEVMMDRYELTRDPQYVAQMKLAWTGFNRTNGMGLDWKQNDYNDDIEWWVISATRAYMLTQDTAYLNAAKRNLDWVYATQWDNALGGGIWWKNNEKGSKNACSNGPGSYAAMNLYKITGDTSYLNKAKMTYAWERKALFNAGTGGVSDHMRANGTVSGGPLFYNQGTFFGSGFLLFQATGDSSYYKDAIKAVDYVRNSMSNRTTRILNNGGTTGDFSCFLIIFVRNMMQFIIEGKQRQYLDWMALNAEAAWKNRRLKDDIMSSNFGSPAPNSGLESSSSSGGTAIVTLVALAQNPPSPILPAIAAGRARAGDATETYSVDGRKIVRLHHATPTFPWGKIEALR